MSCISLHQPCTPLYPSLVFFDTMPTSINLRFIFGMDIRLLGTSSKNMLTQDIVLIIEQINRTLYSPL